MSGEAGGPHWMAPGAINMLHVLVVLVTLLAFAVRWHYLMAGVKARSVDVVESSRWCDRPRLRPAAGQDRHPRARPSASMRERAAAMRPPCKRDPDIFLDNEPIGQQPRVHAYTAQTRCFHGIHSSEHTTPVFC